MSDETTTAAGGPFEKLAGKAKQAVGNLVGNDTLAREGELQEQKADMATQAERLTADAEQADNESELAAEQEANRIEQQRVQAELDERAHHEQIEAEERAATASIAQNAADQTAGVDRQELVEEAMIRHHEIDAAAERIDGAQEAAEIDEEARQAQAAAEALRAVQRNLEHKTPGG